MSSLFFLGAYTLDSPINQPTFGAISDGHNNHRLVVFGRLDGPPGPTNIPDIVPSV